MYKILVNNKNIRDFALEVVGSDPAVKTAAKELKKYLKLHKNGAEGTIRLGIACQMPELQAEADTIQEEGILIRISGSHLTLAGGSGRGVIYAVYEFLERYCGWRFFDADLETAPQGVVALEDTRYQYNPRFESRMILLPKTDDHRTFAAKRHLNTFWGSVSAPEDIGGSVYYAASNAHTFQDLLPVDTYYETHPEYYAVDENGKSVYAGPYETQPCLSHPDVFPIMLENVRKIMRSNPKAKLISVSQNDGPQYCKCPACTKVNEEEETKGGTIYRFVNRIAEAIEEEFPDVLVETLPYVYSTKPPVKTVLRHNVSIRLCLMDTCREHAIMDESCPYNEKVRQYFKDWAEHCSHIYLWDYAANFKNYSLCIPNFKIMYQNMQRYIRFPVTGIMYQDAHTTAISIEFGDLWYYLQAKMLWEPEMDYAEYLRHAKEFMKAFYGAGWEYVYDYLMLSMLQPSSDYHYGPSATCEQIIPMLRHADGSLDMTFIRDGNKLFDLAEAASTGKQLENVKRTRMHLIWYELCTTYRYIRENGTPEELAALRKKHEAFFNLTTQWKGFSVRECWDAIYQMDIPFDVDPNTLMGA